MSLTLPAGIRVNGSMYPVTQQTLDWARTIQRDVLQDTLRLEVPRFVGHRNWMCMRDDYGNFTKIRSNYRSYRERGYMSWSLPTYKQAQEMPDDPEEYWVRTRPPEWVYLYEHPCGEWLIAHSLDEAEKSALAVRRSGADDEAMFLRYRKNHMCVVDGDYGEFVALERAPMPSYQRRG